MTFHAAIAVSSHFQEPLGGIAPMPERRRAFIHRFGRDGIGLDTSSVRQSKRSLFSQTLGGFPVQTLGPLKSSRSPWGHVSPRFPVPPFQPTTLYIIDMVDTKSTEKSAYGEIFLV
jgi:hypothetical protein